MNIVKIVDDLSLFASWPRAFTLSQLLDFTETEIDSSLLHSSFQNNSRFIHLKSKRTDEDRFVLDSTLFQWFTSMNIRLAQVGQFSVTERQMAHMMSHLRQNGRWDSPPIEAIRWGQSLGLIGFCHKRGQFVFPLARLLSFTSPSSIRIVNDVLKNFSKNQIWNVPLKELVGKSLRGGFSQFDLRIGHIVQARECLLIDRKPTLQEIGTAFSVTREYVRQLETHFWTKLRRSERVRRPFIVALLCDFMKESGRLVVRTDDDKASLRMFLAKCGGIPHAKLPRIGLLVLAVSQKDLPSLKINKRSPTEIDSDTIANRLDHISLIHKDVKVLANNIAEFNRRTLGRSARAYQALCAIGRPAHYSEVTEVHNSLFPDYPSTERNIHAALALEEFGIVWIGIRGTYALKKWGYQHPKKHLFDTVVEIVDKIYEETDRPVPLTAIFGEIGKYRRVVNRTSLIIAAHCNPKLRCIAKECFIPRGRDKHVEDEISLEQLDIILRKFGKNN